MAEVDASKVKSAAPAAAAAEPLFHPYGKNGRPALHGRGWPPGVSGNPQGRITWERRAKELFESFKPEFPGLTAVEAAVLLEVCRLMVRSQYAKDARDVTRCANCAAKLLLSLQRRSRARIRPDRLAVPLRERLARAAENASG
jgi:hypothetical protein